MKTQVLKVLILTAAMVSCLGASCITLTDPQEEERAQADALRQRVAYEQLRTEVLQLRERVGALESMKEQQARQMESLQGTLQDTRRVVREMGEIVAEVQQSLKRIETVQGRQKAEIVDEISRKLELILKEQAAKQAPPPPPQPQPPVKAVTGYEHIVKRGETLTKIAEVYGVTLDEVLQANKLKESDPLLVGQKVFIPAKP